VELKGVDCNRKPHFQKKQKESPLTVESIDRIAIKECAQTSFYEALGNIEEGGWPDIGNHLDLRSLIHAVFQQHITGSFVCKLIDGVDNQSPGFEFFTR